MSSEHIHLQELDSETGTESATPDLGGSRRTWKSRYGLAAITFMVAGCLFGVWALNGGKAFQSAEYEADQLEREAEAKVLAEDETDTDFLMEAMDHDIPTQGLVSATMCAKEVGCKLQLKKVTNSNLGGKNNDKPTNVRYGDVCSYNGKTIDMVVTATQPYNGKEVNNGMLGKLGILSMKAGTKTTFTFSFVEAGTDKPVTISSLRWSVLDFDCHTSGCKAQSEKVTFKGYSSYKMGTGAKMKETPVGGGVTIESTEKGGGGDNPTDPSKLTALQERRQVTLEYQGVSSFTVTYELAGWIKNGFRNFIFSPEAAVKGKVPVPCPTPPPTPKPTPPPAPATPSPTKLPPTPPPTPNHIFPPTPEKAMIFVIDVSYSMGCRGGWYCLIGKMKTEFKHQIDTLQGYQWFGIVSFSQKSWMWKSELVNVNAANIKSAKDWVDDLEPVSGTYYHVALQAAYNMPTPPGVKLDAIYFLSDGHPNDCRTSRYVDCFKDKFALKPYVKVKTILLHNSRSAMRYLKPMAEVTGGKYYEAFI